MDKLISSHGRTDKMDESDLIGKISKPVSHETASSTGSNPIPSWKVEKLTEHLPVMLARADAHSRAEPGDRMRPTGSGPLGG